MYDGSTSNAPLATYTGFGCATKPAPSGSTPPSSDYIDYDYSYYKPPPSVTPSPPPPSPSKQVSGCLVTSTSSTLIVKFTTDKYMQYNGFSATYQSPPVSPPPATPPPAEVSGPSTGSVVIILIVIIGGGFAGHYGYNYYKKNKAGDAAGGGASRAMPSGNNKFQKFEDEKSGGSELSSKV
jgi:hypothetical protein